MRIDCCCGQTQSQRYPHFNVEWFVLFKKKLIDSTNNEFSISALQSGRSIRERVTFQISLDKSIAIDNIKTRMI